eukprot:SAG11_NODE_9290_length_925_cov_1.215496_1_plen_76_part_00
MSSGAIVGGAAAGLAVGAVCARVLPLLLRHLAPDQDEASLQLQTSSDGSSASAAPKEKIYQALELPTHNRRDSPT